MIRIVHTINAEARVTANRFADVERRVQLAAEPGFRAVAAHHGLTVTDDGGEGWRWITAEVSDRWAIDEVLTDLAFIADLDVIIDGADDAAVRSLSADYPFHRIGDDNGTMADRRRIARERRIDAFTDEAESSSLWPSGADA